ncbi:hypothetical protein CH305_05180 [Rhodococcus sp. 15-649-2-2]|uniref:hypothetical protein n=1 Tax=Rhodococcus sp. 15-649-2-2 TaxID=2023140 RepID=UPI000B9A943F|nr:hypothetical protein [Rhodococcus sp. 15-649-2-2]OZE83858.1 hypothetical protein CH305_05180 [Rhodococcus sp. 15-649-2-2]
MTDSPAPELGVTRTFAGGIVAAGIVAVTQLFVGHETSLYTIIFGLLAIVFGFLAYWAWAKDSTTFFGIVWGLFTIGTAVVFVAGVL